MVKRLTPPAPSAPASQPAAAVLEPPVAAPVAQPPAGSALPALSQAQLDAFKSFGAGAAAVSAPLQAGVSHPYVIFFHDLVPDSRKIATKFPNVKDADPVLKLDGDFYLAHDFPFTILRDFQYWTTVDDKGTPTAWHLKGAQGMKEVVETLMLLLTPEPVLTLTRLKTTKCRIAEDHRKAIAEAQTPAAIARDATLGAMAGTGFPPAFRIMSKFAFRPKAGKNYSVGGIATSTTTAEQAQTLMAWFGSAEGQKEIADLTKSFESMIASVKAKAK